jgi:hypothetical protein
VAHGRNADPLERLTGSIAFGALARLVFGAAKLKDEDGEEYRAFVRIKSNIGEDDRIRAHALICFLALVLYRVLRMRLKSRDSKLSPERALEIVRRIQFHQITLHQRHSASGLSAMTTEQKDLFEAFRLPTPSANAL